MRMLIIDKLSINILESAGETTAATAGGTVTAIPTVEEGNPDGKRSGSGDLDDRGSDDADGRRSCS